MEGLYKRIIRTLSILLFLLTNFGLTLTVFANITSISDRTTQVQDAIVAAAGVDSASEVTEIQLGAITSLNLRSKGITELSPGDFSGMTGLTSLNLYDNELSNLPDDVFIGLTALTTLRLGGNSVDPLPITVSLEKVGESQFRAVVPTGAPFEITLSVNVTNGAIVGDTTTLTLAKGTKSSNTLMVSRTLDMRAAVPVDIDTISNLPVNHYGYVLSKSDGLPVDVISGNVAPVFTDGSSATREITENVDAGINIGTAVAATDIDGNLITYTLDGPDAAAFEIDAQTGQLKTKAALDYETKSVYSVTITVSDGLLTDSITVTINVIDGIDNIAPTFTEGIITVRRILENTEANVNIGKPVVATDNDGLEDLLTYSLSGFGADSFEIDSKTGQLKTKAALDYEAQSLYIVKVIASDGELTDTITVVVQLIDFADTDLVSIVLPLSERTTQVQDAILASLIGEGGLVTQPDIADIPASDIAAISALNLRDAGITQLKSGDFSGMSGLSNINLHNNSLNSLPVGLFEGLTGLTVLRLGGNLLDPMPLFVSLQQVDTNQFQVFVPSGAPFDIVVPIHVTDGYIRGDETTATVKKGTLISDTFTVIPINTMGATTPSVDIGNLPALPPNHFGYILAKSTACNRSPEVVTAVEKMYPLLMHCQNVADVDLATITFLDLHNMGIKSLRTHDFSGMLSLSDLYLNDNELTHLPDGLFHGLPSLNSVNLSGNSLTELPAGIFQGVVSLESLDLSGNSIDPLSFAVYLEKVDVNQIKAVMPVGAPFDIVLPLTISNGNLIDNIDTITIPQGSVESELYTISRIPGTIEAVTVEINTLPGLPALHVGYKLVALGESPLEIMQHINVAPVFREGASTTRSVPENTLAGVNIGDAIIATDANDDELTYSLGGDDAEHFALDSSTGQLQTKTTFDYEMTTSQSVLVSASDGSLTTTIAVTIHITNVAEHPIFTEGASTNRTIAENTVAGSNIGDVIAATDPDNDTLSYTLSGADAASFDIDVLTGQLKTKVPLDYETKASYSVLVSVSDGSLSANIDVIIKITDIAEEPVFVEGATATRTVSENTASGTNIGGPIRATDEDGDKLTYSLSGTDAASFDIDASIGQLKTKLPLDYETKASYSVLVSVSDGSLSANIDVIIKITDIAEKPVFIDGVRTSLAIIENTAPGTNIGEPIRATDEDGDALTYSLSGTHGAVFDIDASTGQLKTKLPLDYETQSFYSVLASVSDGSLTANIRITIIVSDIAEEPVFIDGASTTRTISEDTAVGSNIGEPIGATDEDGDDLTYSLSGIDAASFDIDSSTGQLKSRLTFDYETKASYTLNVSVSDGQFSIDIDVVIYITNIAEEPEFSDGVNTSRTVDENAAAGTNVGRPIRARDSDNDKLTYSLSGIDAASFDIDASTGQLKTKFPFDYETRRVYSVLVSVSDGSFTVNIGVVIIVRNIAEKPVFIDGANTSVAIIENTFPGTNIGGPILATDEDGDKLTYSLSGRDAASFDIDASTGQLKTKSLLDYETKASYLVKVSVFDGVHSVEINVFINIINEEERANQAPVFSEGDSTTRSINENVPIGTVVGAPVSATDLDGDTLRYSLDDRHTARFSIDVTNGQIRTKILLDYEAVTFYSLSVIVTDGKVSVWINILIEVINLNDPPIFELDRVVFTLPENTAIGQQFGRRILVSEQDGETIDYSFGGTDSSSFSFGGTPAILQTVHAFDYGTKSVYSVSITASDQSGGTDTLEITINIMEVDVGVTNFAPTFTEGTSTTRSIAENTAAGTNIGDAVSALDADQDTLTYSLSGTDAASFDIVGTSGQIQTKVGLDFETKNSYSVNVDVSDGALTDQIAVTIELTDANDPPVFATDSVTFSVREDTPLGAVVGTVSATDQDGGSLRYRTSGADDDSFSTDLNSGRVFLLISSLDYETKTSYSITITALDRQNASDSIDVTINITDVDEGSGAPELLTAAAQEVNPNATSLLPNYPNPFNPETWIPYHLSKASNVRLTIFNSRGVVVRVLRLGYQVAGFYTDKTQAAYWDGRNAFGERVATGVYFATFQAGDFIATRKMLIRK